MTTVATTVLETLRKFSICTRSHLCRRPVGWNANWLRLWKSGKLQFNPSDLSWSIIIIIRMAVFGIPSTLTPRTTYCYWTNKYPFQTHMFSTQIEPSSQSGIKIQGTKQLPPMNQSNIESCRSLTKSTALNGTQRMSMGLSSQLLWVTAFATIHIVSGTYTSAEPRHSVKYELLRSDSNLGLLWIITARYNSQYTNQTSSNKDVQDSLEHCSSVCTGSNIVNT